MVNFGSKEGLPTAVVERYGASIDAARGEVAPGAGPAATVVAEYELMGDGVIRMLALEDRYGRTRR